jgi:hypothetical protein
MLFVMSFTPDIYCVTMALTCPLHSAKYKCILAKEYTVLIGI